MCGICGIFQFQSNDPIQMDSIERMSQSMFHRGPDDGGAYLSGSLALGFRRLSIIDLSPAGHQPMSDIEQQTWVVFNGEIYNYLELRKDLERLGRSFRSNSDTEVIVQGYKQWGDAVLDRLNGMFGLAIWDESRRRLIVARDAMGIKPIYFSLRNGSLYFGSEIRAVVAGLRERKSTDPIALNLFLKYRYTPSPLTLYSGIQKLAAGERLVVSDGVFSKNRWYRYIPKPFEKQPTDSEASENLLSLYKAAVKRHLISDVPVGLLLSGGIDSGLLLGIMNLYGSSWPTFTVGYGQEFKDDELEDAAETARLYSARNATVRLDRETFESVLPKIVDIMEEPVASSSIVPMYFVSKRAREGRQGGIDGTGTGRALRRLSKAPGSALRLTLEKSSQLAPRAIGRYRKITPKAGSLKEGYVFRRRNG